MADTPDHMQGIENAVPKWDFSKPFDPRTYDDAAKALRAAAVAERAAADKERFARSQEKLRDTMRGVNKFLADKAAEILQNDDDEQDSREPLEWDGESDCFSDLEYDANAGGVWAWFKHGGQTPAPYFYPMSRAQAAVWFDDPSAGGYFSDEVK